MLLIVMSNVSVITVLYAKKQSKISPEKSFSKACPSQWEDGRFVITDLFYVKKEITSLLYLKWVTTRGMRNSKSFLRRHYISVSHPFKGSSMIER